MVVRDGARALSRLVLFRSSYEPCGGRGDSASCEHGALAHRSLPCCCDFWRRVLVKRPSAAVYAAAAMHSTCLAWRSVLALLCDADRRVLQFAKALIRASHV